MRKRLKPLWRCPKCGEWFVTENMWHSCGKYSLETLFAKTEPHVFKLFKKFSRMVRACGPVRMIPQKTRVVFQVRVRFAGCYPRKSYLICSLGLPRKFNSPRFVKIEEYTQQFVGHQFRVTSESDLDDEVQGWLREAYRVGEQQGLTK
ncbi:MAG: DUF5655 domain-containing protein [Pyrinomonadaceae bacterium]|nr:DUF5655 domain-containing protein [Pyrinomonadaceae bacterium]